MKNMKPMLLTAMLAALVSPATAQLTNSTPVGILSTLEQYIVNNDVTYNGWQSNHFTLWEGAVFSSVNGVPGASALGNDLGLEIPIHKYSLHLDSATRFETLMGDVHSQQVGLAYDYNLHQIQLSAGLDARYMFTDHAVRAVPYLELKKASTSLYGTAPFIRYGYPVSKSPGSGEVDIGLAISF